MQHIDETSHTFALNNINILDSENNMFPRNHRKITFQDN